MTTSFQAPWTRSLLAEGAGIVTLYLGVAACFALVALGARPFPGGGLGTIVIILIVGVLLGVCVGGVAAGYVAGRIAGYACVAHAAAVPVLAWVVARFALRIGANRGGYPLVYVLVGLFFSLVGGWIASRRVPTATT